MFLAILSQMVTTSILVNEDINGWGSREICSEWLFPHFSFSHCYAPTIIPTPI